MFSAKWTAFFLLSNPRLCLILQLQYRWGLHASFILDIDWFYDWSRSQTTWAQAFCEWRVSPARLSFVREHGGNRFRSMRTVEQAYTFLQIFHQLWRRKKIIKMYMIVFVVKWTCQTHNDILSNVIFTNTISFFPKVNMVVEDESIRHICGHANFDPIFHGLGRHVATAQRLLYSWTRSSLHPPRCFLGMVDPFHFFVEVGQNRYS